MNCRKATKKLSAYLDGELASSDASRVRAHVDACPRCASALEELRKLDATLDAVPALTPRPGYADRIVARAEQKLYDRAPSPVGGWARVRPALARLAAAVVFVMGLWLGGTMAGSLTYSTQTIAETEEATLIDLQVDSLSAVPSGSVAETYLALLGEEEE